VGTGFQADPGLIDNLAKMLHNGADSLNGLAGSAPAVPDAGGVSGVMATLIAKQMDAAGEIAVGVGAAADAVAQGGKAYTETDNAVRQALPHAK
jgi:hypothetical protein